MSMNLSQTMYGTCEETLHISDARVNPTSQPGPPNTLKYAKNYDMNPILYQALYYHFKVL